MKKNLGKIFVAWVPFAIAITLVSGVLYAAVQQNYRQSANDPQIQAAEDAAQTLGAGANPQQIVPPYQIDIAASLSPYIMLFSAQGQTVISSAILNGQPPTLPTGVFSYLSQHNEDRFTWQPAPGVRSALVVDRVQSASGTLMGFVAVGRSLREVEIRESSLMWTVIVGWLVTLIGVFAALWLMAAIEERGRKNE